LQYMPLLADMGEIQTEELHCTKLNWWCHTKCFIGNLIGMKYRGLYWIAIKTKFKSKKKMFKKF